MPTRNSGYSINLNLDYQNAQLNNKPFPYEAVFKRSFPTNILPSVNCQLREIRENGFLVGGEFLAEQITDEPSVKLSLPKYVGKTNQNP